MSENLRVTLVLPKTLWESVKQMAPARQRSRLVVDALDAELRRRGRLAQLDKLTQFQEYMRQKYGELPGSAEDIQAARRSANMTSQVCIDASLVVAILIPERLSQAALNLWKEWMFNDWKVIAPMLIRYEVASAIYRKSLTGVVSIADSHEVLEHFLALDIETIDPPGLSVRAMQLAEQFHRPNLYDAHYLALAQNLGCPIWTGDERLYNAVKAGFGDIFLLGQE